ncbi:unnamed protein product [Schistosoma bovis]|nr:unnamed protein product [Schistosoma bovis]
MSLVIPLIYFLIYLNGYNLIQFNLLSDELIQYVNNYPSAGWKASKQNRFKSISDVYNTLGHYGIRRFKQGILPIVSHEDKNIELPDYFDSREQWKDCPSINIIHDQSKCDSGWAVASAASISDRTCIQTNGTIKVQLSAIELISCTKNKLGCQIGYSEFAWNYWLKNGLVTGDSTGCLPYPFPKCDHRLSNSYPKCGYVTYTAPPCEKTCRSGYPIPYIADKHYGKAVYSLRPNESDIRKEIIMNGPVEAGIFVHSDFFNYKSGVYKHIIGRLITIHSVRIIGWGIENDIPYWLCANSWNEDWGLNGYFKILRGSNECEIESFVNAGKVDNKPRSD